MNILIIKLGAKGDVIRTLPIAKALKENYKNSNITWITKSNAAELISNSPFIDKTYVLPFQTDEQFDMLYNFDIEEEATHLAKEIKASKK